MNDDKNLNQTDINNNDYQKILDEYAASVKPEDQTPEPEPTAKLEEVETKTPAQDPLKLKDINSLQLEAPDITPVSIPAQEKIIASATENLPPSPETTIPSADSAKEPTRTPEQIKAEIDKILADDSGNSTSSNNDSQTSKSGGLKGIFVLSLIIFFIVAGAWAYFLFLYPSVNNKKSADVLPTPTETVSQETCEFNDQTYQVEESFPSLDGCNTCSCKPGNNIVCTEMACATTPSVSTATKSAAVTSTTKTAFQKMVVNFSLYKDITPEERKPFTNGLSYWTGFVKENNKLYSFTQKMIKGSIKMLSIDHRNLNTILTDEDYKNGLDYTFYLTPNYEKWTNKQFKELPYEATGLGDLTPLYAYSDKLIWTTRTSCGGARAESVQGKAVQDQCNLLVKEIETAFP